MSMGSKDTASMEIMVRFDADTRKYLEKIASEHGIVIEELLVKMIDSVLYDLHKEEKR